MKIALLSPVAWRTPPEHYGPWEQISSNIAEGLIKQGHEVTLFATGNSTTAGTLAAICDKGYEEDKNIDPKVAECMHIGFLMEQADQFDIIHNNFDFLPLTYSRLIKTPIVTTIHGFSSPKIIQVYKQYNDLNNYVSISNSDRSKELKYIATVYNGIKVEEFELQEKKEDYLLFFGRIHHDKGAAEAIEIAKKANRKLIIAGIIQDEKYYAEKVLPHIDSEQITFIGPCGPQKRNEILGNASVLLHPINFAEPFGLSVVEAMLCGTPIIAFNKGSMPELIKDKETGFLVDNVDEAVETLKNLPKIDFKTCHSWAKDNFSQEKMAENYLEVYKKILNLLD
ncbi:glycosyltransferase family 4 protein [bacterium]|nr:glycosyltransferase family 4 protein [bacterium]